MSVFYKIDSTKVTFQEFRWGNSPMHAGLGWLLSKCGAKFPSSTDDPNVEALAPFEVHETAIPADVQAQFQPLALELAQLGFHSPIHHVIRDAANSTLICWSTFAHVSGQAFARIHYRLWTHPRPQRVYLYPLFCSTFADGSFLHSTSGKPDMAWPAQVRMNRHLGAGATALWQSHWALLQAEAAAGRPALLAMTDDEVRTLSDRAHAAQRDFHLGRGVFKPMSGGEQQQAAALGQAVSAAQAAGGEHAEVMVELNALQNKKSSFGGGTLLLLLTMAAFAVIGGMVWGWKFSLLLIPILLFHEFGHYVAMLLFKYRNLKMLFIPLFGAAVVGQNYNVPGWKKVIVSLMGPVPGIFLGCVLGTVALIMHNDLLLTASLMLVAINAFNLLPVLPLDGGWVLHTILFCRNAALDAGFRVVAGLGLVATGILLKAKFLPYLAIPMFLTIPTVFKLGRIVERLRERGVEPASEDSQTIPSAVAQTIIGELKAAFPKGVNNKILAQHTLSVFETLNARPPHWAASLLFLAVHGGTVLVAIVAVVIFMMGKGGDMGDLMRASARAPRHALDCGSTHVWRGPKAPPLLTNGHHTLVTTLKRRKAAEAEFRSLPAHLPADARLTLFGNSLLLTLPPGEDATRQKWAGELQRLSNEFVVERTNYSVGARLHFIAPTEEVAQAMQQELDSYFHAGHDMRLVPPWQPARPFTAAERKARRTWQAASQATSTHYTNATLMALNKRVTAALRTGEDAEAKRLREQIVQLTKELRRQSLDELRRSRAAEIDPAVLDQFAALPEYSFTNKNYPKLLHAAGAGLGQLPDEPEADRYTAPSGFVHRAGLLLTLDWLTFQRVADGAPALLDWVCARQCISIKYEFPGAGSPLSGGLDGDEEE